MKRHLINTIQGFDLTHWGRVTHICVGNLNTIDSDNGLSPDRRQAIIWTNAGILSIGPMGINFSEISMEIQTFSFRKNALKIVVCEMPAILSRSQCVNMPNHGVRLPAIESISTKFHTNWATVDTLRPRQDVCYFFSLYTGLWNNSLQLSSP